MLEQLLPYLVPLAAGWLLRHAGFLQGLNVPFLNPANVPATPAASASLFQQLEAEIMADARARFAAAVKAAMTPPVGGK